MPNDLRNLRPSRLSREKLEALLDKAGFGDNDTLYILGDVIDRNGYGDSAKLGYKETREFSFEPACLPEGASVHVFVNGEDHGEGTSVKVKEPTESYTVQAKVLDENGNVIAESGTKNVKVKNTLCARIWYFFMKLLTSLAHAIGKTAKGN